MDLQALVDRSNAICQAKGWEKTWSKGGCYIHLEVSEFIEALRGKGNSTPEAEAGDVLMALFAVMGHYNIKADDVISNLKNVMAKLETTCELD